MSTSAITSSLLSQIAGSPSTANKFATDLNQLAKDLQSGSLSAAQQDYVTLSQDALDGATATSATTSSSGITTGLLSTIAASSGSSDAFASALTQLGTDLTSGSLSSAQGDLLTLDSTALNAATSGTSAASTSAPSKAESSELIHSAIQALDAGDDSLVSTLFSQLASTSSSAQGASLIQQDSASFSSGTGSSSSASSITQLLNSASGDSSSSTPSIISTLA